MIKQFLTLGTNAVSFIQSNLIILLVSTVIALGGSGFSYIKGRADGYEKCVGQVALRDSKQKDEIIAAVIENRDSIEQRYLDQAKANANLSDLIRQKVKNTEKYYKELQGEPIYIKENCDGSKPIFDYDDSLGVLERAAKGPTLSNPDLGS